MGDFPQIYSHSNHIYGGFSPLLRRKVKLIKNNIFLTEQDKNNVIVGFSKKSFKYHKGISGLKYYLIVMYFRKHLETFGQVSFTLNKLLEECGYSTKSHNKSIYDDFINIIENEIIKKGFAFSDDNIFTIKPNQLYRLSLSTEKSLFFTEENFVQISIKEFETIANSNIGSINKSVLIGVYLFIKQFILDESSITENLCRISYPSKQQIKKGIGIASLTTIESAISILESLKLIYVGSDMFVEDSDEADVYIPTRNVYALSEDMINNDAVLVELEDIYKRRVYRKNNVPGNIKFLNKEKDKND